MTVTRRDADFESDGTRCAAWLYRSEAAENPPAVVTAHGFGGDRDWRLPAFAERFADRGMAVLLFDYRRFGDSAGEPRNLITPEGHVRDWLAAVEHARGVDDVERARHPVGHFVVYTGETFEEVVAREGASLEHRLVVWIDLTRPLSR